LERNQKHSVLTNFHSIAFLCHQQHSITLSVLVQSM